MTLPDNTPPPVIIQDGPSKAARRFFYGVLVLAAMGWVWFSFQHYMVNRMKELDKRVSDLWRQNKIAEATRTAREALTVAQWRYWNDPHQLGMTVNWLAQLNMEQGNFSEAELLFQRLITLEKKTSAPEHDVNVAASMSWLAECYRRQGKNAAAEPLFRQSLGINEQQFGKNDEKLVTNLLTLGLVLADLGHGEEAIALGQRVINITEKKYGPFDPHLILNLDHLANFYMQQKMYPETALVGERALLIAEKSYPSPDVRTAKAASNLAVSYYRQKNYARADALLKRSLDIYEKATGPTSVEVAKTLHKAGLSYALQKKYALAIPLLDRSLAVSEIVFALDDPEKISLLDDMRVMYDMMGRPDRALDYRQRLAALAQVKADIPQVQMPSFTGDWIGDYSFAKESGGNPTRVRFKAKLVQQGEHLEGTIAEPNLLEPVKGTPVSNTVYAVQLTATLKEGNIHGYHVQFRKEYNGEGGFSHSVDYTGTFDPEHKTLIGQWRIGEAIGPFTMKWNE